MHHQTAIVKSWRRIQHIRFLFIDRCHSLIEERENTFLSVFSAWDKEVWNSTVEIDCSLAGLSHEKNQCTGPPNNRIYYKLWESMFKRQGKETDDDMTARAHEWHMN